MVSLICAQKIKEELIDFYHNIEDNVLQKCKFYLNLNFHYFNSYMI
jgi:hypothetical protein